jgi:hypothetical protein
MSKSACYYIAIGIKFPHFSMLWIVYLVWLKQF